MSGRLDTARRLQLPSGYWSVRFWRQRGDNLLEAGVAAQRVPERQEFQLAIADGTWRMDGDGQLLTGEILIANPPGDHRQVLNHERTVDRILLNGKKLHCAAAFAQRFFSSPETSVDQPQNTQCRTVIWLGLDHLLLLCTRRDKGSASFVIVVAHSSDNAFH